MMSKIIFRVSSYKKYLEMMREWKSMNRKMFPAPPVDMKVQTFIHATTFMMVNF